MAGQTDLELQYCADPREAVTVASQIQPTVILQDLVMPEGVTLDVPEDTLICHVTA